MDKMYVVYCHTFPNGKKYVGITSQNVKRRWRKGKGYASNIRLTRAFQKYGWDNVKHEILYSGLIQAKAELIERALIKKFLLTDEARGYNLAPGGTHPEHSEKTKKLIGEKSKGRRHTREFKKWISKKNAGRNNFMYGKHHTEATKKKISESKKGKSPKVNKGKFGANHPAAKTIEGYNEKGIIRFGSIVDASNKLGINKSCLQAALHGKQKTSGGYRWRYV